MTPTEETRSSLHLRLPAPLHRRLRIEAAERGTTMAALVIDALHQRTPREQPEPPAKATTQ